MKIKLITLLICAVAHAAVAAPKPAKISKLFGFKGSYSGSVQIIGGNQAIFGSTNGKISASKKKEIGNVALKSIVSSSGTPVVWNETYGISKRNLKYSLFIGPSTFAAGSGRVNVSKKTISYSGTFVTGSSVFFIRGKMTRSGKDGRKLKISETITGPTSFFVTYNLTKQGK